MGNPLFMRPRLVMPAAQSRRSLRSPKHTFALAAQYPWCIQPFLCAPVLAGETLKNFVFQAREVIQTAPDALTGWWSEWYWFYVPLYLLREEFNPEAPLDLTPMLINPTVTQARGTVTVGTEARFSSNSTGVGYVQSATTLCVQEFFRSEGEPVWGTGYEHDGLPLAKVSQESWLSSLIHDRAWLDADVNVDLDASGTIFASEVNEALQQWELLRLHGLTELTYEDYLASHGVKVTEPETGRPEVLRMAREWAYPVNTIDPTDGSPSSAVSWSHTVRGDKSRFFRHPGLILGLHVTRPKVYFGNQTMTALEDLDTAWCWLPAMQTDTGQTSWVRRRKKTDSVGPLGSGAFVDASWHDDDEFYRYDVRDLFNRGDQFRNQSISSFPHRLTLPQFTPTYTNPGTPVQAELEAVLTNIAYPPTAEITSLFGSATSKTDGVQSLAVMTRQRDLSPAMPSASVAGPGA